MTALARVCNASWLALCLPEARRFHAAGADVQRVQSDLLRRMVHKNRDAWFGQRHRFGELDDVEQFRSSVPLSTYDDYREPIDRIARGEQGVLTADPVLLLEPTSGTTSAEKLVPYTAGLRRQFQRAVRAWIADLFRHRPAVRRGSAYWSVTPLANRERVTPGGIRVGFHDDSQYLAAAEQVLLYSSLAVPPAVARCESVASALYATSFFLLRCRDLALVSVWSPTFLTELLAYLREHADAICRDVAAGTISQPMPVALARRFRPMPERAAQAAAVLAADPLDANCVQQLWPDLAVASCWCDGPSAIFAENLREQLAGVEIQPKGLLATEAAVTIPLVGRLGAALAVRSHFFEFLPADSGGQATTGRTLLAHELQRGERYQVVVTTAGGFYRYQMRDEVEVVGLEREIPLCRFLGKSDDSSDMVGEKLSAAQVQSALDIVLASRRIIARYAEVVAEPAPRPSYLLRIAAAALHGATDAQRRLGEEMDDALRANPGYAYARALGQLGPLRVQTLAPQEAAVLAAQRQNNPGSGGQRYGSQKPRVLIASQPDSSKCASAD